MNHQHSAGKDFRVAIVGGGMCGLVLAIALVRSGLEVDLFESAPKFGEVGAGVGLGPNAIRVLRELGVMDAVEAHSGQSPAEYFFSFLSGYEEPELEGGGEEPIHVYETRPEDKGLPIHRATFLEALIPLLPPSCVQFSKRCTSTTYIPTTDTYRLTFADGTTHDADLVVGADGIRSTVRRAVLQMNSNPPAPLNIDSAKKTPEVKDTNMSFSGDVAYRSLVPIQELREAGVAFDMGRTSCHCGPNSQHFITFPVSSGEMLNVVAFAPHPPLSPSQLPHPPLAPPWTQPSIPISQLEAEFTGWNKDITTLVKKMKRPSKWYIHALDPPLGSYIAHGSGGNSGAKGGGRIVLIGDAAHATTPHLGAGVGQGFEDVYVLWRLFTLPWVHKSHIPSVLQSYNTLRLPRANNVILASKRAGVSYNSYTGGSDSEDRKRLKDDVRRIWEDVWHYDVRRDLEGVVRRLEGELGLGMRRN